MGTNRGEIRGKTKDECWEKYQKAKSGRGSMFLVHMPSNEKTAREEMKKDESGEYVLSYIWTM